MTADKWLQFLVLGAVLGAVGQLLRVIAGVAKESRKAAGQSTSVAASTLVIGGLVGACAGVLAVIAIFANEKAPDTSALTAQTLLGLIASGYAGADFIEGVAGRYFPDGAKQSGAGLGNQIVTGGGADALTDSSSPAKTFQDPEAVG